MGFFAEGSSEPGGASAWDQMAPLKKDFAGQFKDARGLYADAFNSGRAWAPNAKAATVAPVGITRTDATPYSYQKSNAQMLADIASGKGGGVAEGAMRAGLAKGASANNAVAVSRTRGPNALAGATRTLGNTNAGMAVGAESKIAAAKAQEQLAAEAALTPALAGMRAQDMGIASEAAKLQAAQGMANAGFANQMGLENQFAGLAHDAWLQKALGSGADYDRTMWENEIAKRRNALGMDIYDQGKTWRNEQMQDAGRGYTADTMGSLYGAAFKYGNSNPYGSGGY
jgi:hypothetical protein